MKNQRTSCLLLFLLLPLASCAPQKQLMRHYASFSSEAPARSEALTLSVFPASLEADEDVPLILQLTERAQAELIRSVSTKIKDGDGNEKLMALLSTPTVAEPATCAWAGKTKLSKRLVINVLGDLPTPADRIDKLDIVLVLEGEDAGRARFLSWDRFASKYGEFNIGTAKFTQANKFTAGSGNTNKSAAVDATSALEKVLNLGYENSNALEESASYALHRLTVGGELSPHRARLVQEGAPNHTLFGASIAIVSLALTSDHLARVHAFELESDGKRLAPSDVKVESCPDIYPALSKPVMAAISGTAQVRLVKSGGATVSESDDEVVMVTRNLSAPPISLASTEELSVDRFTLGNCVYKDEKDECTYLYVERDGTRNGNFERVVLPSLERAVALRSWLMEEAKAGPVRTIGKHRIGISGEPVIQPTEIKAQTATGLVVMAHSAQKKSSDKEAAPTGR